LLLINGKARHGRSNIDQIRRRLTAVGLDLIVPASVSRNASETIRQSVGNAELIVIGGGDGTINQALPGLLDARLPFGILPMGTANDLARTLELPADPIAACDVILAGRTKLIDVGRVNGQPFLNVASIGLATQVTRSLSQGAKSRWGVLAYGWAALRALFRGRPFTVDICCEGQVFRARTWQVTVGNGRSYGGGLTIHEGARIDDGLLNLYSLEVEHSWQLLPLIPALWHGKLDPIHTVRTMQGTKIKIVPTRRPRSITADGELLGKTPAVFEIQPQALSVFA
jgi:YegS/Rv2252/BmrU family lipid kinase